jgi:hypothetical protein
MRYRPPTGPCAQSSAAPACHRGGPQVLGLIAGGLHPEAQPPLRVHHVLHKRSVLSISKADATSALIEENVRVRATPFLVALLVLSNDNSKAHARAPIAVLAGYAKS